MTDTRFRGLGCFCGSAIRPVCKKGHASFRLFSLADIPATQLHKKTGAKSKLVREQRIKMLRTKNCSARLQSRRHPHRHRRPHLHRHQTALCPQKIQTHSARVKGHRHQRCHCHQSLPGSALTTPKVHLSCTGLPDPKPART